MTELLAQDISELKYSIANVIIQDVFPSEW
jgi:hypothetical protein